MEETKRLQQIISESSSIVFFGGAGVSTESGIPDFRSVDGLYHQQWDYPPETILSHTFFMRKPEEFYRFYKAKMLAYMKAAEGVPKCEKCGGIIKPDVVLYEESLDNGTITRAVQAIAEAEVLIIGGTSLAVDPAASLIDYFSGKHLVVINRDATPRDRMADLVINEPIAQVFSQIRVE